ncbi:MAG TPA: glycosyltransferase family 4 protein [Pyrinomonadaceae bacterium]|nr:glycosyltransferase family 4 protein [Pyrinomonadaceae bacterium]
MDGVSLKLLYFSRGYTTHDRRFLESFVASGFEVSYLRLIAQQLDQRNLPDGVDDLTWSAQHSPLDSFSDYYHRFIALSEILAGLKPDAVVAGPVQSAAFLVALTQYSPLITMSWGSDLLVDSTKSLQMSERTRFTLNRSAGALGDCQAVRDKIHSFTTMPDERIVTFPWGIDLQQFSPGPSALDIRQKLQWERNPVLISTRTWEPLYSIDVLVKGFASLVEQHPEARLLLLGDGSESKKIFDLIAELELSDFVHTPGRVGYELLPDYFRSADLYVSSALSDGTSISLLEAMACGLPVVVSDSFGNKEWVKPLENGWLFSPGDSSALARALGEALSNLPRLQTIKAANVEVARSRANWNENFPQLVGLIKRVTSEAQSA